MDLGEILKSRPIIILIYKYTVYIYPVSWCLSNREDQILLTHYFENLIIKKKTGTISPKWFMFDNFDGFYNAWILVFNRHPQKSYVHDIWIMPGEVPRNLSVIRCRSVKSIPHSRHTS